MPWRQTTDPYKIFISEVMLQQTQVDRVIPKFESFIQKFPTIQHLASAEFKDVLLQWSGLGYNRRALWLHQAAKEVTEKYSGIIPDSIEKLTQLKGVGHNTAAAICAYAFNRPVNYIETNIRAVFIHHFFQDRDDVHDKELLPLVEEYVDKIHPREWYWALMDYGVYLKKLHKNPARMSKHHIKQSTFEGSNRQLRGRILKLLLEEGAVSLGMVAERFPTKEAKVEDVFEDLVNEGLVVRDAHSAQYSLS